MTASPDANLGETTDSHWNRVYEAKQPVPHPPNHPVLQAALAHLGPLDGLRVCDVGCGTGEYALAFAAAGAEVVAIDRSEMATQRLARWAQDQGMGNLTVVCDDALALARYGPFDRVFGAMILHHIEPFPQMVQALDAALKRDGRAFFHENNAGIGQAALWFRQHLAGRCWFPKHGDAEEFPLTRQEVAHLQQTFRVRVVYPELALFRLVSHYIFRGRLLPSLFDWLDHFCFRFARLRSMSYQQFLLLSRQETGDFLAP
jgi:2-polyprenyl-3-methyl-5-hydroxy-6-metoxy-1,4-benzoquinol methylase